MTDEDTTAKELQERARVLNIEGRSTMNKERLEAAIAEAEQEAAAKAAADARAAVALEEERQAAIAALDVVDRAPTDDELAVMAATVEKAEARAADRMRTIRTIGTTPTPTEEEN